MPRLNVVRAEVREVHGFAMDFGGGAVGLADGLPGGKGSWRKRGIKSASRSGAEGAGSVVDRVGDAGEGVHGRQLWFCLGQVPDTQEEMSTRTSGVRKDGEVRMGDVRGSKMEMSSREGVNIDQEGV